MTEYWMRYIDGPVQALFGAEGLQWLREHPAIVPLTAAIVVLCAGGAAAYIGVRLVRRVSWNTSRVLALLSTADGRTGLMLARKIRAGSRRLVFSLRGEEGDGREQKVLISLLERFTREDLPHALNRLHTFVAVGGAHKARMLERELMRGQQRWSEATDPKERESLQEDIAAARQLLAQANLANAHCVQLLKGLQEAAAALGALEVEMASLDATRTRSLADLKGHLSELAEGLRFEREAHLELDETR